MKHKCSQVGYKCEDSQTRGNREDYFSSSDHEMLKMSITQTDTKVHGPAFIEVYNTYCCIFFYFEDSGFYPSIYATKIT